MSEVRRYEPDWDAGSSMMVEEDGMYVKHSDYEKLEKRLHDLEDAIKCISYECSKGDMYYTFENVSKYDFENTPKYHKEISQAIKNSETRQ